VGTETSIDFREENLSIGKSLLLPAGTQVQLEIEGIFAKLKSYSVGFVSDECLIFRYPAMTNLGSIVHKLFKGNKIIVGYVDKGNVFRFQSEILGYITEPAKLIFVAYPIVIARHSLRKGKRVSCSILATVEVNGEQFEGVVTDISATGYCVSITEQSTERPLPSLKINQEFRTFCRLPGSEAQVEVVGRVRNFQRETQRVSIGALFHDVDLSVMDNIINFVSAIQKIL
jgi:c-di-GMP-binding flagellar brake protein YcgR